MQCNIYSVIYSLIELCSPLEETIYVSMITFICCNLHIKNSKVNNCITKSCINKYKAFPMVFDERSFAKNQFLHIHFFVSFNHLSIICIAPNEVKIGSIFFVVDINES